MLSIGVLSVLVLAVSAEYCYTDVESACGTNPKSMWLVRSFARKVVKNENYLSAYYFAEFCLL